MKENRLFYISGLISLSLSAALMVSPALPKLQPIFWLIFANWAAFIVCTFALYRLPNGKMTGLNSWKNAISNFWRVVLLSFSAAAFLAFAQGAQVV